MVSSFLISLDIILGRTNEKCAANASDIYGDRISLYVISQPHLLLQETYLACRVQSLLLQAVCRFSLQFSKY
jgi:hypothetical protein